MSEPHFERAISYIEFYKNKDGTKKEKPHNWPMNSGRFGVHADVEDRMAWTAVETNDGRCVQIAYRPEVILIFDNISGELLAEVPADILAQKSEDPEE